MLVRFRAELPAFSTIQTDEIQTHTPAGSDAVRRGLSGHGRHIFRHARIAEACRPVVRSIETRRFDAGHIKIRHRTGAGKRHCKTDCRKTG